MIPTAVQNTNLGLEQTFLQRERAEAGWSGRLVFMGAGHAIEPDTIAAVKRRGQRNRDDE